MPNIKLTDFSFTFKSNHDQLFKNVNMTFPSQQISLLTGPSGCGKSTLMIYMAGLNTLDNPEIAIAGDIAYADQSIFTVKPAERVKLVSMMFQDPNQQFVMQTVFQELVFALENIETPRDEIIPKVNSALAFVDIDYLRDRDVLTLSGGEKQKVILAVMVALDSETLILDEPFASIDPQAKQDILGKLVKLRDEQGKTIIISDHDLAGYAKFVDHLFRVQDENIVAYDHAQTQQILTNIKRPQLNFALPDDNATPIIKMQDLQINVPGDQLLNAKDFNFYPGATLITGPSGIGKSTLFRCICKLRDYDGDIFVTGHNLRKFKTRKLYHELALVFQQATDQFLKITVGDELKFAKQHSLTHYWTDDKVNEALASLNLTGMDEQVVYSLSGGQKKKLQVLLMLIRDQQILLLDEPFAGLDKDSVKVMEGLLETTFLQRGHSLIAISHQLYSQDTCFQYHVAFHDQQLTYTKEVR